MKETKKKKRNIVIIIIAILILLILICFLCFRKSIKYDVVFDYKNYNASVSTLKLKINKDSKVKKPEEPKREGYEFVGWYYNDEPYDFSKPVTKDMVLEARWRLKGEAGSKIELKTSKINLKIGDKYDIKSQVNIVGDTKPNLKWYSSDSEVAIVDVNGVVTAKSNGKAKITIKTEDDKYSATITIIVEDNKKSTTNKKTTAKKVNKTTKKATTTTKIVTTTKNINVTGVSLSNTSLTLTVGDSSRLTATISPSNANNKNISWTSSNSNVARVDSNGNVTAVSPGTVTITVTTADGSHKANCTVTVKEKAAAYKVILTPIVQAGMDIMQYSVAVTKNGGSCNDCSLVIYGGKPVHSTVSVVQYNTSIKTAKIRLSNGSEVSAEVIYK